MGRGRGKGKRNTVIAANDDPDHVEEEKLPASKRRGRPQKPLKNEVEDEEEAEKIESDENAKSSTTSKDSAEAVIGKGRKRKKPIQLKEHSDPIIEENDSGAKKSNHSNGNLIKSAGFRPNGSRRKNKPCRAAEVGVKCK